MQVEWDSRKEKRNAEKHELDFSFAVAMLGDPLGPIVYDRFDNGEHRYHLVTVVGGTCLVMVHTYPDPNDEDFVRVIGLRKATANERKHYEAGVRGSGRSRRTH
jgi:uncharacterized DUF497 family protein